MEDRIIRPSTKTVWAAYILALLVIAVGVWAYIAYGEDRPAWLMAIPAIVLVVPLQMHVKRRLITLRIQDHHLTVETGFFSRTRRTIDMAKVQDVTVNQTLTQRLLGVGDLTLESAGERGSMGIGNLDRPREIADSIIASSKRSPIAITPTETKPS